MDRRCRIYRYLYQIQKDLEEANAKPVRNYRSCVGHYISSERNWGLVKANGPDENKPVQPPRKILGDFCKKNTSFSEEDAQNFARKCLLSEEDVKMWLTNIQTINGRSKKKQKKKKKPVDEGACTLRYTCRLYYTII